MEELLSFINKKTNNKFKDLLFFAGEYDCQNKILNLSFNYLKEDYETMKQNTKEIENLINQFFLNKLSTNVKIKHLLFDEELLLTQIKNFFYNKPQINFAFNITDIALNKTDDCYRVVLPFGEAFFGGKLKNEFEKFLSNYCAKYNVNVPEIICKNAQMQDVEKVLEDRVNAINEEIVLEDEKIKIEEINNIFGEISNLNEVVLATDKLEIVKNIAVCGTISKINIREFVKDEKTKKILSFYLIDGDKKLECICFSKDIEGLEDIENLNDKQAVVLGDVSNYNDKISLKIKSFALCKIIKPAIKFKTVSKDYINIYPEKFEEIAQSNFFALDNDVKNQDLKNKKFVVFDLETTGLDAGSCSIVEIGAVKIENGKITETFETLINPKMHIPDDATKINHITDDMVKNKPSIDLVIGDFYKFCYDCTLVGHNSVTYDMPILKRVGLEYRYNFSNELMDTYHMARDKIKGLKKYKLGFICDHLGISLEGAHRALNDTVATAKLFINLMENYS